MSTPIDNESWSMDNQAWKTYNQTTVRAQRNQSATMRDFQANGNPGASKNREALVHRGRRPLPPHIARRTEINPNILGTLAPEVRERIYAACYQDYLLGGESYGKVPKLIKILRQDGRLHEEALIQFKKLVSFHVSDRNWSGLTSMSSRAWERLCDLTLEPSKKLRRAVLNVNDIAKAYFVTRPTLFQNIKVLHVKANIRCEVLLLLLRIGLKDFKSLKELTMSFVTEDEMEDWELVPDGFLATDPNQDLIIRHREIQRKVVTWINEELGVLTKLDRVTNVWNGEEMGSVIWQKAPGTNGRHWGAGRRRALEDDVRFFSRRVGGQLAIANGMSGFQ